MQDDFLRLPGVQADSEAIKFECWAMFRTSEKVARVTLRKKYAKGSSRLTMVRSKGWSRRTPGASPSLTATVQVKHGRICSTDPKDSDTVAFSGVLLKH
jgi:hypothetical protein